MNIDITTYPEFRLEAMNLKSNIGIMVNKMDGLMASSSFTDAAKSVRMAKLLDQYLPQ